jgi:hypothetical protein
MSAIRLNLTGHPRRHQPWRIAFPAALDHDHWHGDRRETICLALPKRMRLLEMEDLTPASFMHLPA